MEKKTIPSLNSNLVDFNSGKVGGPFDQKLTTYSPSAYYYYDYPHQFAGGVSFIFTIPT